eukprot:TRINITY_DN2460_c0_g1_i1.p1 TRINITY_DN2460_c0_g1~~TRINITY_DN2460_c0_g1_i1.p1  ORF type:complete len:194 (-),score=40.58 TRINITY_DN2460_c0_g1_i1:105-686(-)
MKERFLKVYRHPALDTKLRSRRTITEARLLAKSKRLGVDVPSVYFVDPLNNRLYLEEIIGLTVKQYLYNLSPSQIEEESSELDNLTQNIGRTIALLHDGEVIHGDLTTSNLMIRENSSLVVIDFGLSYAGSLPEDKAVDLYVLEKAFLSTHPNTERLMEKILAAYGRVSNKCAQVLIRLEQVRQRGRKKIAFG